MKLRHWLKSAATGLFVSKRFAARHKRTTYEQTAPPRAREAMRSGDSRRIDSDSED